MWRVRPARVSCEHILCSDMGMLRQLRQLLRCATVTSMNGAEDFSNSGAMKAKAAAVWLYLVAAATLFNSLIVHKYTRFIDLLIGLSFTQFIDAVFVGAGVEPRGSPYWWVDALPALVLDMPFVLVLLILALKVSHRRYRATQVSFWLYAIDTSVFALGLAADIAILHVPIRPLLWQGLTLIVHTVGLFILFRAWRGAVGAQSSA